MKLKIHYRTWFTVIFCLYESWFLIWQKVLSLPWHLNTVICNKHTIPEVLSQNPILEVIQAVLCCIALAAYVILWASIIKIFPLSGKCNTEGANRNCDTREFDPETCGGYSAWTPERLWESKPRSGISETYGFSVSGAVKDFRDKQLCLVDAFEAGSAKQLYSWTFPPWCLLNKEMEVKPSLWRKYIDSIKV